MRSDLAYVHPPAACTPFAWAPLAQAARREFGHRLVRMRRAIFGFCSLWAAACGQDQKADDTAGDVAAIMDTLRELPQLPQLPHSRSLLVGRNPAKAAPVTHVIVLGDSISEGLGAENDAMSYAHLLYKNENQRYPELQGQDLAHLFGEPLNFINLAHHGDTSKDVLLYQLPELRRILAEQAKAHTTGVEPADNEAGFALTGRALLIMTVGGNDVQMAMRPKTTYTGATLAGSLANLRHIFAFFRDEEIFRAGAKTFFGNIYDVTDGTDQLHHCYEGLAMPGMSAALVEWSRAFQTLAKQEDATLIDLLGLFRGHGFNFFDPQNPYFDRNDPTLWIYDRDCIHPNNHGHDELRQAFFRQIAHSFAAEGRPLLGQTGQTAVTLH